MTILSNREGAEKWQRHTWSCCKASWCFCVQRYSWFWWNRATWNDPAFGTSLWWTVRGNARSVL